MRLCTGAQAQQIDQRSQVEYGLSGEALMEAAGALAAREIIGRYFLELRGLVVVLCGPGNNGGDALVVARHLRASGHKNIKVILSAAEVECSQLSHLQLDRLKKQSFEICSYSADQELCLSWLAHGKLIVDGLFGIGLNRELKDEALLLVELCNRSSAKKISLDIPSGLDATTGKTYGGCIRAELTLTFGLAKSGMMIQSGPEHCGQLRVLPIGFPHQVLREQARTHYGFTKKLARRYLPRRTKSGNKSTYGHLLVAAGHRGTMGAGILTARAAARIGVGYVTLSNCDPHGFLKEFPEFLFVELSQLEPSLDSKFTAIAAGPGFGKGEEQRQWLHTLRASGAGRVVLDADALTICKEEGLFPLPKDWVITPHSGELSKLLDRPVEEIDADRFQSVRDAAKFAGCTVLLKGYHSLISNGVSVLVILSGNGALAKAGTGDVLTGLIGGLMAQGVAPIAATATASFVHGQLADDWVRREKEAASLMPSDLIEALPGLLNELKAVVYE